MIFTSIENFTRKFYSRISDNVAIRRKDLKYYIPFLSLCLFSVTPFFSLISQFPDSFYDPTGISIANLFTSFPHAFYFYITDFITVGLLILLLFNFKVAWVLRIVFVILTINYSFYYAFGKIDRLYFPIFFMFILSFAVSFKRYNSKINLPLVCIGLILCIGYLMAGFSKLFNWIDFDLNTSGLHSWIYGSYYSFDRDQFLIGYALNTPIWLSEISEIVVVLFEITGFIFLLRTRNSWITYLLIASIFHLGVVLILNISFISFYYIYSLWIIAPLLKYNKIIFILPIISIFLPGLYRDLFLWGTLILIGIYRLNHQKNKSKLKNQLGYNI